MNRAWIKSLIQGLCFGICTFALICEAETCVKAAGAGIELCIRTLIPSLFPFLVFSRWAIRTELPSRLAVLMGGAMGPLFSQPAGSAICLILGAIGGYPVGAQTVALSYEAGTVSRDQAERLLGFCCNAGPAFFFGVVGAGMGGFRVALTLYVIHLLSAAIVGFLAKPKGSKFLSRQSALPRQSPRQGELLGPAISVMGKLCAYVVLFSIVLALTEKHLSSLMPPLFLTVLSGLLEVTTGCLRLREIDSLGWQYCLASGFLSFGGLCVMLQIRSVLADTGLTGRHYIFGKLLQSGISVMLTWAATVLLPGLLPLDRTALYLPNHQGLLGTFLWVVGSFLLIFMICSIILRKRTGNAEGYGV